MVTHAKRVRAALFGDPRGRFRLDRLVTLHAHDIMRPFRWSGLIDDFFTGGAVWLKNWAERNTAVGGNPDVVRYLGIYFAFGVGAATLVVFNSLILWIFCSIEVSRMSSPIASHPEEGSEMAGWRGQFESRLTRVGVGVPQAA